MCFELERKKCVLSFSEKQIHHKDDCYVVIFFINYTTDNTASNWEIKISEAETEITCLSTQHHIVFIETIVSLV